MYINYIQAKAHKAAWIFLGFRYQNRPCPNDDEADRLLIIARRQELIIVAGGGSCQFILLE